MCYATWRPFKEMISDTYKRFSLPLVFFPLVIICYSDNIDTMYISLDNISFYSYPPPVKSASRAFPVPWWKPYQNPPVLPALSHASLPRPHYPRTTTTLGPNVRADASPPFRAAVREDASLRIVRNEFDIELEKMAMAQDEQVAHKADLAVYRDLGYQCRDVTDIA